jgi:hypothetical protein
MDVPKLGGVLRLIRVEQRLELGNIVDVRAAQPEALGDRRQIGVTKDRAALVDAVGAQLVDFRAIGAIIEYADKA